MELLNLKEAANKLRCSTVTVRRLIKLKRIPYRRIGSRYMFTLSDIEQYLSSVKNEPVIREPV